MYSIQCTLYFLQKPMIFDLQACLLQYLNHPETDCTDPNTGSMCITALQAKQPPNSKAENLRNEEVAKSFPFELGVNYIRERSTRYFSKSLLFKFSLFFFFNLFYS